MSYEPGRGLRTTGTEKIDHGLVRYLFEVFVPRADCEEGCRLHRTDHGIDDSLQSIDRGWWADRDRGDDRDPHRR